MATVTKPLALNESLNSTENTPRNIADVLADELDGIKQAINNQSGSGNGHIIQNSSGANMPSENTMQFVDAHLSDDSVGGKTVVETFKAVTEAEYSSETEDGAYIITDGDGAVIEPASEDYVEVVGDNAKTLSTLLNNLFSLSDYTKISKSSIVVFHYTSGNSITFFIDAITTTNYIFSRSRAGSGGAEVETLFIRSTDSTDKTTTISTNGTVTVTDDSSHVFGEGTTITLYYGNKKAIVDLQTTANRCLMPDGETTVADIVECDKTTAGTYALKCTVDAQGNKTYSWV